MQTATDHKWIVLYGAGGAHSDSKELVAALLHLLTHVAADTRKSVELTSKPSAEK
jgi:hypothetical protein